MKKLSARLLQVARNPVMRPVEVWALRLVFAYVALKLGVDAKAVIQ